MRIFQDIPARLRSGAWLFLCALTISVLGTLPIGTLNVSVAGLAIHDGTAAAVEFSVAAILVEVILVRLALVAVKKLEGLKQLYVFFNIVACIVMLLFAGTTLEAAWHTRKFAAGLPFTRHSPFVSGFLLSILNPLHLPFWMSWTAVLRSKKILRDSSAAYNVFVMAIGAGTSMVFFVYGLAGNLLIGFLMEQQTLLNWIVGLALLLTAILQFYKAFLKSKPGPQIPPAAQTPVPISAGRSFYSE